MFDNYNLWNFALYEIVPIAAVYDTVFKTNSETPYIT